MIDNKDGRWNIRLKSSSRDALSDGIPDNGSDNEGNGIDLEEIVDGVLQVEEEVSPSLVRPGRGKIGYHNCLDLPEYNNELR